MPPAPPAAGAEPAARPGGGGGREEPGAPSPPRSSRVGGTERRPAAAPGGGAGACAAAAAAAAPRAPLRPFPLGCEEPGGGTSGGGASGGGTSGGGRCWGALHGRRLRPAGWRGQATPCHPRPRGRWEAEGLALGTGTQASFERAGANLVRMLKTTFKNKGVSLMKMKGLITARETVVN